MPPNKIKPDIVSDDTYQIDIGPTPDIDLASALGINARDGYVNTLFGHLGDDYVAGLSGATWNRWIKIADWSDVGDYQATSIVLQVLPRISRHGGSLQQLIVQTRNDASDGIQHAPIFRLESLFGGSYSSGDGTFRDAKVKHVSTGDTNVYELWVQMGPSWLAGVPCVWYFFQSSASNTISLAVTDTTSQASAPTGGVTIYDMEHFKSGTLSYVIDGGNDLPATGIKGRIPIELGKDERARVVGWTVVGDAAGSCQIDLKKSTYAGYPTTASMVGTGTKPGITSAQKNEGDVSDWTGDRHLKHGDILEIVLDSVTTLKYIVISLELARI